MPVGRAKYLARLTEQSLLVEGKKIKVACWPSAESLLVMIYDALNT
jgi:hypothetical protein